MSTFLHRATAWLCLAIASLTSVAPAQGFTLCVQPGGSLSVDMTAAAETCGCCATDRNGAPSTPIASHESKSGCCACLDLPVPASAKEPRVQPEPIVFQLGPLLTPTVCSLVQLLLAPASIALERSCDAHPRPPASIALIRSVVLLV